MSATLVAPATVVGVALGFGAQQVVADLLAGFFLFAEHQFGYGDEIRFSQPGQTDGVEGVVEEMTLRVTKLRVTKLRTIEGEMVIVRNSELGQVTNMSKEWSQAVLDIPVAPGEDLELASSVMRTAAMTEAGGCLTAHRSVRIGRHMSLISSGRLGQPIGGRIGLRRSTAIPIVAFIGLGLLYLQVRTPVGTGPATSPPPSPLPSTPASTEPNAVTEPECSSTPPAVGPSSTVNGSRTAN